MAGRPPPLNQFNVDGVMVTVYTHWVSGHGFPYVIAVDDGPLGSVWRIDRAERRHSNWSNRHNTSAKHIWFARTVFSEVSGPYSGIVPAIAALLETRS